MNCMLQLFLESGVVLAVLMPLSALCGDININEKTNQVFTTTTYTEFFASDRQDIPDEFRQAITRLGSEHALKTGEYPRVVAAFTWWLRYILKDEYIPDNTFISDNLQLFTATENDAQDRAILLYRKAVNNYLIVQTGGSSGRLYMGISGNDVSVKVRDHDDKRFVYEIVSQYINVPSGAESPEIRIYQQGKLHLVTTEPARQKRNLQHSLKAVFTDGEVVLSFGKILFGIAGRAWAPEPNHWFETEKKAQEDQLEVERAQARLHSPESIEKGRMLLEKELWPTNATKIPDSNDVNSK